MPKNNGPALPEPVRFRIIDHQDADVVRWLWNLFRHDMSGITGALPDADGRYRSERLERALASEAGWQAWLATAAAHPVGFAVVRALEQPVHIMTSFFVVAAARRSGVGTRFARTVMNAQPGHWRVAYQDTNEPAARFWSGVAATLDPNWTHHRRPVPGRPDLPPDSWIDLTTPTTEQTG